MLPRFEHHFSSDHTAEVPGYTGGDYDEISGDQFDDVDGPPEVPEMADQPEAYHVAKTDAEAPSHVQPPQEGGAEIPVPVEDEPKSCLATNGQPVGAQPPGEESAEGSPEQQADEKRTSNLDPAPMAAEGEGGELSEKSPGSSADDGGKAPVIAGGSGPLEPNGREESGANQAQREYEAAAAEYIQHARETPLRLMQREVVIPTPDGPIAYGAPQHPSQGYAIRNGDRYRKMAFGDEFVAVTEDDEEYEGERTAVKRREDQSGVVAGGIERALGPGQVVIDLGCGHAIADHEFAADYPLATIIGIDRNLKEVRDIDVDKPGLQLTQGNWDTLDGIQDGKATVVVSVGAAEAWGEIRRDGGPDFISAVNRVTAPGAVFRFHFPGQERFTQIEERLHELGWVVDRRQYTVIAVKPGP